MAQIFVSHSGRDEASNKFIHKAFSLEAVRAFYFEFEPHAPPPGPDIEQQIKNSNALFVVLGPNAAHLPHTRSWIDWEAGVASGVGREIWVFEPYPPVQDLPIPKFSHYMVVGDDPAVLQYVRLIIRSYDDSAILPAAIGGGAAGLGLGHALRREDDKEGAVELLGAIGGTLLGVYLASAGASSQRPPGMTIRCPNMKCQMMFQMHTALGTFPCPACRQWMTVSWGLAYQRLVGSNRLPGWPAQYDFGVSSTGPTGSNAC